ncbi:MAG: endonuclease [Gammaproteobacteria bacterium]|nr:endonuclease [Gammaproteobacteria bacterium]
MKTPLSLAAAFDRLLAAYGTQSWWPADSAFEVMVGAILTQNTAWVNVEKALVRLREAVAFEAHAIAALAPDVLAAAIRPAGYFNVKARRLQAFCAWLQAQGGIEGLAERPTAQLRADMLAVHGVGPETADDMLLYALERPVFVVDAYTRRIFARLGLLSGEESYEEIRALFEGDLPARADLFKEYHALIVTHGKGVCRPRPRCEACCLQSDCAHGVRG